MRIKAYICSAPWFVPTMNMSEYETHDLERRVEEAERKLGGSTAEPLPGQDIEKV